MNETDNSVHDSWCRHWHAILDDVLGEKKGFDLDAAIADPSGDFRMHFCTWDLPDEDLFRCFSIFSCGDELARRSIEMRDISRNRDRSMTESEAIEHMRQGINGYRHFSKAPILQQDLILVRGAEDDIFDQVNGADYFGELLEYMGYTDPLATEIDSFLSETLYRVATSIDVREYILWPLYVDVNDVDPQRHFALIDATEQYFGRLTPHGPTLFVITD